MRPLLVGLMPNRTNGGPALTGVIGRRLCIWAGIPPVYGGATILRLFDTVNLNARYADRTDGAQAFSMASLIRRQRRPTILCGREVASYFGLGGSPFWSWFGYYVVIPHPSGRCRTYNQLGAKSATGSVLTRAIRLAKNSSGQSRA